MESGGGFPPKQTTAEAIITNLAGLSLVSALGMSLLVKVSGILHLRFRMTASLPGQGAE
jgi:hypothetical protein